MSEDLLRDTTAEPQGYGQPAGQTAGQTQYGQPAGQSQYGQTQYGQTAGQTQYGQTMGQPTGYGQPSAKPPKGDDMGFGIASFVLGILSFFLFSCCINYILAVLAIIFGIIQMVKNRPKGLAIAGIVTAVISMLLTAFLWVRILSGMDEINWNTTNPNDFYHEELPFFNDRSPNINEL